MPSHCILGKEEFLSRKRTRKIFEMNKNGLQRSPGSMGRIDQLEKAVKITVEDSRYTFVTNAVLMILTS